MKKIVYPVCLYKVENSSYTVIVPDLEGCVTQGSTIEEAFEMAVDAASGWVLDELESGKSIPKASDITEIKADDFENGFVSIIMLDIDSYAEKNRIKTVRKNCTLPSWLNTRAEAAHINFSSVLQEALIEKLGL